MSGVVRADDQFALYLMSINPFTIEHERFAAPTSIVDEVPGSTRDRARQEFYYWENRHEAHKRSMRAQEADADEFIRMMGPPPTRPYRPTEKSRLHAEYEHIQQRARENERTLTQGIPDGVPSSLGAG